MPRPPYSRWIPTGRALAMAVFAALAPLACSSGSGSPGPTAPGPSAGEQGTPPSPPTGEPPAGDTADLASAPRFTPYTVAPRVTNRSEVAAAVERAYPPALRAARIGGTAQVWLFIDETGQIQTVLLRESSGHPLLDEAALNVARLVRFTPPYNKDKPVPVWISIPISFVVRRPAPAP